MGNKIFALFVIVYIVFTFRSLSSVTIDGNYDEEIMHALHLSAEAALLEWDLPRTANAGIIVLHEGRAVQAASDIFRKNTDLLPVNADVFSIEIINDAPCTKNIRGDIQQFVSNGVLVEYEELFYVLEIDDR